MNCPSCKGHSWPDKTRGMRVCPNCRTQIRLTRRGAFAVVASQRHTFRRAGGRNYAVMALERIYTALHTDGTIACANCAKPTRILDSIDGRLDGDGLMRIEVESQLPSGAIILESRVIPQNVRGRFCASCQRNYPVKPIGRMVAPGNTRFSLDYEVTAELRPFKVRSGRKADASETWKYTVSREVDKCPEWAHTGDATWLACSTPGKVYARDDDDRFRLEPVGRHPAGCGCPKCPRHELPLTAYLALAPEITSHPAGGRVHYAGTQVNAVSLPTFQPRIHWPVIRWTFHLPAERLGRSANRVIRGINARERIGRMLTIADTYATAIHQAIAIGDASAAYRYARLAARHPAARRIA